MKEINRLRLKLICCNMMMVTAAISLTFRALASLGMAACSRPFGGKGVLACGVIWLGFLALSWFFSRWAVKPVKEAVGMQKQFVADASHELKTPLTIIIANAGLLQEKFGGISAEADRWLEHVNQECREMRSLVEGLLTLAKKDACPRNKKDFRLFSLSDVVTEKILTFEPVFYQEEKPLSYRVEKNVLMKGNPHEMGQLVQALIDNAVKYSVEKGLTEIRLEQSGWNKARLWVNSQGNPIPRDRRRLIFRRFYRDDKARSSRSGYGLGLAIASKTARCHRASIEVDCKDGMNCFCVTVRKAK